MKIVINEKGNLRVLRAGTYKAVLCPYHEARTCGDWCALFGEPVWQLAGVPATARRGGHLDLCGNRTLFCENLEDRRPGREEGRE